MTGDKLFGWAAVLGAIGVITGQIFTYLQALRNHRAIEHVHEQVKTTNGATIGEIVEANDLRTLNGEHDG